MEKPNLNKMWWRTWVKIGPSSRLTNKMFQDTIRHKMYHISQLHKTGEIHWYYFLWHNKPDDPSTVYFDVVFTTGKEDPNEFLPRCCIDTNKIPPMKEISGIDPTILKDEDIAYAWKIIGEQSEFIIALVRDHKENCEIPLKQIAQFMHYFMNPLGLGHRSISFFPAIPDLIRQLLQRRIVPEYWIF